MQVSAISSAKTPEVTQLGKNCYTPNFKGNDGLSEAEIQHLAIRKTVQKAKERQQSVKRLFLAVPLVAGLATAALHKGNIKVLGKEISGKAAKLAAGIKDGGNWAYLLGLGTAIGAADATLAKKSEGYGNFRKNHPMLGFATDLTAFIAASALIPLGLGKLASKINPKHINSLANGAENIANHINAIKMPKFIGKQTEKIAKHIPDAIKNFKTPDYAKKFTDGAKATGKMLLSWAPHVTFLTAILAGLTNQSKTVADYAKNYKELKENFEA